MNATSFDNVPVGETFGEDASFKLEQPIGAMSISPSGRDVVLASKEGLHIIDLDSPYSPPRYLPHRTPWEVADVQWSPFASKDYWIVSTSNQKALVWNVGNHGWRDSIEFVLHGHTRAITDINFSAFDPYVLATCAVDSFVHAWDLRTPSRPAFSFSDWFAGATQVKWSRQDEHVIASSHDRFLHIWDKRKGAYPARTLEAHGTKIYGLDWNRFEPSKIVTCSLDKTIKFWNTNNPDDIPERVIETPFPVWRARHTPFGWGLLAMPQRGNSELHLYDRRAIDGVPANGQTRPVTTFPGHKGHVKEFLWRARGTVNDGIDNRDFQLVSWGSDRELRLHRLDKETFKAIGYEKGASKPQRLHVTRRNARYRTFRDGLGEPASPSELPLRTDSIPFQIQFASSRIRPSTNVGMSKVAVTQFRGWVNGGKREKRTGMHGRGAARQDMDPIAWMKNVKIASWDLDSLAEEIKQVGEKFKRVEFETVDISQRKAVMSLQGPWGENRAIVYIRLELRFPQTYPRQAQAIINIQKTNALETNLHRLLSTEVNTISETYKSRQRGCIEAIVRYLLNEQSMEQIVSWILDESITDSKLLNNGDIPDDLSSDSDDDNLVGVANPSSSSANIRMPLPKACGAIWSNDGRLVCFFPQKPKEPASLLAGLGDSGIGDSQSKRTFEAFGRLHVDSPARKALNGTQMANDDTASDISDTSSTFSSSSSSSSSSSEAAAVMRDRFELYESNVTLDLRHRSRSGDGSNRSTTMDGTKAGGDAQLNYVTIRSDTQSLIPSKMSLAQKYEILGHSKIVCDHNAAIAEQEDLPDIASVWRLSGLILEQNVPLDIVRIKGSEQLDIIYAARRYSNSLQRKDSAVDLSSDYSGREQSTEVSSRWGGSPLATGYLITAMFDYFERIADVQMLAMLACIFSHADYIRSTSCTGVSSKLPRAISKHQTYLPPSNASLTVLPSTTLARRYSSGLNMALPIIHAADKQLLVPTSNLRHQRRSTVQTELRHLERLVSESDPIEARAVKDEFNSNLSNPHSKAMTTSASSVDLRTAHRPLSGTAFAASRASLNALAQSFSNSPPSNGSTAASSYKRFSPSTSLTTGNWSGAVSSREPSGRVLRASTLGEAASEDSQGTYIWSSVSSVSLYDMRRDSQKPTNARRGSVGSKPPVGKGKSGSMKRRKRTTKTVLHHQQSFDLDGYAEQPLLDVLLGDKYRAYRTCYAELLATWGLWLQRAELLHFDQPDRTQPALNGRRASIKPNAAPIHRGLDIVRCCHKCGNALAPIEKNGIAVGWHCTTVDCLLSPSRISKRQVCSICQTVLRGLTVPCLQCGHATCYDCAQLWFGESSSIHVTDEDSSVNQPDSQKQPTVQTCPTGCGCSCTTISEIKVPAPPPDENQEIQQPKTSPSILRSESAVSEQSVRFRPEHAPDTALGAMMALSYRSRATSTAGKSIAESVASSDQLEMHGQSDELVPWPSSRFTSLGRGLGGGLSRGLSNRSSDATIRKG